jgi:GntP family gluconate:H+ symporter
MSHNSQLLLCTLLGIGLLVLLIVRYKLNSIIALIVASLFVGLCTGMNPGEIGKAFEDGVGGVLGSIAMVIGLGTVLGKMLAESGGAQQITQTFVRVLGADRLHWAMAIIAFIVGLPVFFAVGFVLLVPIVFALVRESRKPLLFAGLPLVTGLAMAHSLVPPHPGIMAAIGILKCDVGKTILWSMMIALPITLLVGPLAGKLGRSIVVEPGGRIAEQFGRAAQFSNPPSFGLTLFTILLPVLLMLLTTAARLAFAPEHPLRRWSAFIGHPVSALTIAVLFSFYSFGFARGFNRRQILQFSEECLGAIAPSLLIVGAGGGFNRILSTSGVGNAISELTSGLNVSPFLLAWLIAAAIRIAVGSATVAITAAAGLVLPILANHPGTNLELLVIALGAGSMMLSHVNDGGFWIVKEYFNLTVAQTFKTWSMITTAGSILGLIGVLILEAVM